MYIEKSVEHKKAKLKFIVTAVVSLLLIFIIVSCAFLNVGNSQPRETVVRTVSHEGMAYVQANTVLQHRLQDLDNTFVLHSQKKEGTNDLLKAQGALQLSLDSLQKTFERTKDNEQQGDINSLLLFFRKALQTRIQLANKYANLQTQTEKSTALSGNDSKELENANAELEKLKTVLRQKEAQMNTLGQDVKMLADKDKQIAALTAQLQQAANHPNQEKDNSAAVWKQKFTTLEARFKELDAEYNVLSQSYQNAASNNRKLLSQLQAVKKS